MKPGARQAAPIPIAKTHSLGMSRVSLASRAYSRSIQGRIDPTADDDTYLRVRAVGSIVTALRARRSRAYLQIRSGRHQACPADALSGRARWKLAILGHFRTQDRSLCLFWLGPAAVAG